MPSSISLGSAHGKIVIDASSIKASVRQANSALGKLGGVAAKLGTIAAAAMAALGAALGVASAKLVQMGADAGETASLLATSLGPATEGLNQRLRQFADDAERSFFELQEGAATFVAMTRSMGATQEQASQLSGDFTEMATDLGSFFNVATENALLDLQGALAGSSETMQKYGIDVRETTLKQMALEQGLISTASETLPRFVRAQLIAQAVTEQASDAMGDAERTAGSFQNQLRGLQGEVRDAATEIGVKLIPTGQRLLSVFKSILPGLKVVVAGIFAIFSNIVNIGIDFVQSLARSLGIEFDTLAGDSEAWGENFVVSLAEGMAAAISAVVGVLNDLGLMIQKWLGPGSPPKLLPDLPEWGASAMTEFMRGWLDADFSVFEELTTTIDGMIRSMSDGIKERDVIERVLGSRAAIAGTIQQVRETGRVTRDMLDRVMEGAGLASRDIRSYVESLLDVAAADQEILRAQEELNRVTAEYNAILDPLNSKLQAIRDRQSDIRDEEELGRIRDELSGDQLTALERESLLLRRREILLQQQIRDAEREKDTAEEAAEAKVTAAEKERDEREAVARQIKDLLDVQREQNTLLSDQEAALDSVAGAAGRVGEATQKIASTAIGAAQGLGSMAGEISTSFDEVFDRVSEKFDPLTEQVETLGETWGTTFETIGTKWDELQTKWEESAIGQKLAEVDISLQDIFKYALLAAGAVLLLKTAFTVGGWIAIVAGNLAKVAGYIGAIWGFLAGLPGLLGSFAPGGLLLGVSLGIAVLFEDELNSITTAINDWLDTTPLKDIEDAVGESLETTAAIIGRWLGIYWSIVSWAWGEIKRVVGEKVDEIIEDLTLLKDEGPKLIEDMVNAIIDFFEELWKELVGESIIPELVDEIITQFTKIKDEALQPVMDVFNAFREGLESFWRWLQGKVFSFVVDIPFIPDWLLPENSPTPLQHAWEDLARFARRMRIAPKFDLPSELLAGAFEAGTVPLSLLGVQPPAPQRTEAAGRTVYIDRLYVQADDATSLLKELEELDTP